MFTQIKYKLYAKSIGIENIYPSDVFIASYPKSGNTWIRFIIANILSEELITMKNVNNYVPGIYNFSEQINAAASPRFIKTHDPVFKSNVNYIYIYRDYRDVLISYYHFQKNHMLFSGSFTEFFQSDQLKNFGGWKNHVTKAIHFKKNNPSKMLLLSYESMVLDLEKHITAIAAFLDIIPKKEMKEIRRLCHFEALSNNEKKHGNVFDIKDLKFFRSGKIEQWREELPEFLQNRIIESHGALLEQLDYPLK